MIRIAICDDEKNIRTYLSSLVRKQNIECEITEYASTDEYLSDQKEHDLLFLDIEMKSVASGMDGMSMAKQIRATELTKQPIIIFVTGYEKYVYGYGKQYDIILKEEGVAQIMKLGIVFSGKKVCVRC